LAKIAGSSGKFAERIITVKLSETPPSLKGGGGD
jgi:hypothetical protein